MIERFEKFSFMISEISRYWHKIVTDEMKKYGLKGINVMYLTTLYRFPEGVTAAQLCELCGKDKSDVSRVMNVLAKKGLVVKTSTNQNLYRALLKLTEEGKKATESLRKRACLAVEIAGEKLTEEGRAVLYDSLEEITNRLREISKEGLPNN